MPDHSVAFDEEHRRFGQIQFWTHLVRWHPTPSPHPSFIPCFVIRDAQHFRLYLRYITHRFIRILKKWKEFHRFAMVQ